MTTSRVPETRIENARRDWDDSKALTLFYGGSIVVQLGAQLYPSVTASVAELISNAWDADARNVWVSVPLEDGWHRDATIEVLDDGRGMSREDAQFEYLVIGRERRRSEKTDRTLERQRKLHGRKGIGKLAAFGTGRLLEVVTKKDGQAPVGFRLDYEVLRKDEPGTPTPVEELPADQVDPLVDRSGKPLAHGTRVRLTRLQSKRRPNPGRFLTSMRRRFALDDREMRVEINGEALTRFDMDFAMRFPRDGQPPGCERIEEGFAVELVDDGTGTEQEVKWWIGFTSAPIKEELLQGVTVLVHGKQAQRAFKFERTGGEQGQLGYEYLVGEVHADWIDDGYSDDGDLISSDRDTLQLEDERLQPFVEWGRRRLAWATRQRDSRQGAARVERWRSEMPAVAALLGQVSRREQQSLGRVAERLARVGGIGDQDVADVMGRVLQVREGATATRVAEEIRSIGDAASQETWQRAREARDLERRTLAAGVEVRLAVLEALHELLDDGDRPPRLAATLADHPWILDLAFDRSTVTDLAREASGEHATLIIGSPPWLLDESATLVVAVWPSDDEDFDVDAWLVLIEAFDAPATAHRMLVSPTAVDGIVHSWSRTLERSTSQHEAWRTLLRSI